MFKSSAQGSLFTADHEYKDYVGTDTFYGFLAENGYRLFPDEMFESLYCADNGRPCASPCMLTKVMLLQMYDGCSDAEAVARASYDLRWKVALGVELDERPFAKSTLQLHRARVHLSGKFDELLAATNQEARRLGILKRSKMTVAVDTTPVYGRGAVKDTYNLVADGIKALCRALGDLEHLHAKRWAHQNDFRRYFDNSSVKGMAAIDWSNDAQRRVFLASLVADVDRILLHADRVLADLSKEAKSRKPVEEAANLLRQLVEQDVERTEAEPKIREGVAKDRIVSVTDPEMRHGRKSASKRFDGHKAGIAVDTESQLIVAVEVAAGNSADQDSAMDLVEAAETNTGMEVEKTIGDCAYGSGETRQQFAEAGRELVAKVPSPPKDEPCHKWHFNIDVQNNRITCPAGHVTEEWDWTSGECWRSSRQALRLCQKRLCQLPPRLSVHWKELPGWRASCLPPSSGAPTAGRSQVPGNRGIPQGYYGPPGRGTSIGSPHPTGNSPSAILRAFQDQTSGTLGGRGSQPHPTGWNRPLPRTHNGRPRALSSLAALRSDNKRYPPHRLGRPPPCVVPDLRRPTRAPLARRLSTRGFMSGPLVVVVPATAMVAVVSAVTTVAVSVATVTVVTVVVPVVAVVAVVVTVVS